METSGPHEPLISVVIPVHNGEETLEACLAALERQTVDRSRYEVIVVDDGSTDRTPEIARRHSVHLIRQEQAGPAVARNRGAEAARGQILLFTDADCIPAPDWIARMVAPFRDPEVVGAKGVYRTHQQGWVPRFVQVEYEERYRRMAGRERIDFVDTYSAAYRRDVFLANGGFDPLFPTPSVEDQEFSFRLARKGYRLVFVPDAVVYHRHDQNLAEYWRRKFRIGYWKTLLLRWHPERAVQDSHTPQTLKAQVGLMGMMLGLALLAPFLAPARWGLAGAAALFLLTTVPFLAHVLRRDPALLPIALPMLAVRALALGTGMAAGLARFGTRASPRPAPISGLNRVLKRGMDIVGGAIGLLLSGPLIGLLAVAIKLDSPGPVFFVQERAGLNGRPFRMVKLRTMVDGAEEMLEELVDLDSLPAPAFKLQDDPRVTRVGRFLRRTSLDELPQFWNVLRGEMSLVGPRPEEMRVVRLYEDWHRQRLAVKPGMTGPMQVNGRADLSFDERVRLELDYIENYSLWKDLCILAKTVIAVLSGRGAY
ncbi:MAG TPA: glycosyltransferase [Thermoflexia bacterium]|jgi:lipopolysaccharide/colanic/teichoic acid biosynthesis glycosyltransferase/GT2 family glycosyltransferase|nr:glycosyltransferase [Thermoflexia bacterium]